MYIYTIYILYRASVGDEGGVIVLSALNSKRQLVEAATEFRGASFVSSSESSAVAGGGGVGKKLYWGWIWYMNTPLENLEADSSVLIEYKLKADGPVVSSTSFALERDTIDSQEVNLSVNAPSSTNPIYAQKEKGSLIVEIMLYRKPISVSSAMY
jgi:hypothetical protein